VTLQKTRKEGGAPSQDGLCLYPLLDLPFILILDSSLHLASDLVILN
jgi:hypothetical protein